MEPPILIYPKPKGYTGKKCKICSNITRYVMNIKLEAIPICDECANAIMLQQAKWLIDQNK